MSAMIRPTNHPYFNQRDARKLKIENRKKPMHNSLWLYSVQITFLRYPRDSKETQYGSNLVLSYHFFRFIISLNTIYSPNSHTSNTLPLTTIPLYLIFLRFSLSGHNVPELEAILSVPFLHSSLRSFHQILDFLIIPTSLKSMPLI